MRKVSVLDRNLCGADAYTPDGIVPFNKIFDLTGDAETEVLILFDGDESLALSYTDRNFYEDIYVGDTGSANWACVR